MDIFQLAKQHFYVLLFQCVLAFPLNQDIKEQNCTIHPSTSGITCTQYTIEGFSQCSKDKLESRFPALYETENRSPADIPGQPTKIRMEKQNTRNITWKPPINSSIRNLKGFLLTLEGRSFENFGAFVCIIIDLTQLQEDQISALLNATFQVIFDSSGDFDLHITSLPLPDKHYEQPISPTILGDDAHEYHPNMSVDISAEQLNASAANISIDTASDHENISSYLLEAIYDSNDLREISDLIKVTISAEKKYAILENLKTGNYTLKLRPKNDFPDDKSKCVCYTGLPNNRICTLCRSYVTHLQIEPISETPNEISEIEFLEIGVPVIVTVLLILLLVAICLLLRRAGVHMGCATTDREDSSRKKTIYLFHASDNETHGEVIKVFIKYLEDKFNSVVVAQVEVQLLKNLDDTLDKCLNDADLIVVIHSEAAYRLYNFFKTSSISRNFGPVNNSFLTCITKLVYEQNCGIKDKLVTVRFDYTPKYFVIEELQFNGFNLINEIDKLEQYAQSLFKQSGDRLSETIIAELIRKVEACKVFQSSNPLWFSDTYRHVTKSSFSSDDSGVDVQRDIINSYSVKTDNSSIHKLSRLNQNTYRQYHNRSLSLETLSGHFCRSASVQRGSSLNFSVVENRFISPEFGDEKEDTPTVLLTEQMNAINDRYDYIVSNEFESDDECFTQLGTSV